MGIKTTGEFGPRHYYDESNPSVHYPSVTSITKMLPKDLTNWHTRMAGERAVDSLSFLPQMVSNSRDHAVKYVASASADHNKAARVKGDAGHDMFERMLRGAPFTLAELAEKYGTPVDSLQAMHANFSDFLERQQPELCRAEDVAWSDTHGYAGSFDISWWLRKDPETGRLDPQGEKVLDLSDFKTGKNVYPDVAVQLVAYAMADRVATMDGGLSSAEPSPTYDGLSVLHINDKVCTLKPIRREVWGPAWNTFLAAIPFAHAAYGWQGYGWGYNRIPGAEDRALGDSLYTKSGRLVTGTERRS